MICPRCGKEIDAFPCPNCGFPETLDRNNEILMKGEWQIFL